MKSIRRTSALPDFASYEASTKRKYPRSLRVGDGPDVLRYRLSRPWPVGDIEDGILRVEFFGWLVRNRRRVGAFELSSYEVIGCGNNSDFWEIMDCDALQESQLATVLCDCWRDVVFSIGIQGPILHFASAWIRPDLADGSQFAQIANAILDGPFAGRSILVLKGYPIEYAGEVPDGSELLPALQRRQSAMRRYYRQVFDVAPLPGKHGDDGWLWRANSPHVEPPDGDETLPR